MWQKLFRAAMACLILVGCIAATPAARAEGDPSAFIQDLGDKAIGIIKDPQNNQTQRKAKFSVLFTEGFDVPQIGRFVLGRHWRTATPEQQQEYLRLYGLYVVAVYSERFSNYSGEQFTVTNARPEENGGGTVISEIRKPGDGPAIKIEWKVAKLPDGKFKITDVIVENLSMALTQKQEFSAVIERGGGNIDALIQQLKMKVNG